MFHSVGNTSEDWYRNWLSTEFIQFENFCSYLKTRKFRTISLDEWYFFQNNKKSIIGNEVVLTFDDGYLDNWVFAFPILKKYGLRATIFINPEFIDPSLGLRPTFLAKQSIDIIKSKEHKLGFLNWDEIKALDESRVMDIQSHSMSHNFYFHTNKIIDIYEGQKKYDWIPWFTHPERKPFYLTEDQTTYTPVGYPIFEFTRALKVRRYFPDQGFIDQCINSFKLKEKNQTANQATKYLKIFPGRFETDQEMEDRYTYELFKSKSILEERLNKKIDFLCWPGGGYNELSINLSQAAGYKASTIASADIESVGDNLGEYKRIQRFGMGSFMTTSHGHHLLKSKNYLIHNFNGRSGKLFYRNLNRARKLGFIIKDFLFVNPK